MKTSVMIAVVVIVAIAVGAGTMLVLGSSDQGGGGGSSDCTISFTAEYGTVDHTSIKVQKGTTWNQQTGSSSLVFSDGQTATVSPNSQYKFESWSIPSGTANENVTIKATCVPIVSDECTITFNVASGEGSVPQQTVVKKGSSFNANANTMVFSDGTRVTATPGQGYVFGSWDPTQGTVTSDMSMKVSFKKSSTDYTVTISAGTGGSVSKTSITAAKDTTWTTSGNILSFSNGQSITATPDKDYTFGSWNPASGTVTRDVTISASFVSGGGDKTVSFYLWDNFENDGFESTDMYATYPYSIIDGIWIKGTGKTTANALEDACKTFDNATVTISNGKITNLNGVTDGNIYLWGWTGSEWIQKNSSGKYLTLDDLNDPSYQFVAIIHGAASDSGNAPSVNRTPGQIGWYYGDTITPGSGKEVRFYLSNNFMYTTFVTDKADKSDYTTLIVPGIWIRGYADNGSHVMDAFRNALDRIGYKYDISDDGFINSVNYCEGGNFLQAIWDNANGKYYSDSNEHWFLPDYVDETDYAALVYGAWEGGHHTPPWPEKGALDYKWGY